MARVVITAENQIERLNRIQSRLKEIESLSPKVLVSQSEPNKWSIAEIIEHMSISYSLYTTKLNNALGNAKNTEDAWSDIKAGRWVSMLLKNFRPKKGKLKMTMKTQKMFEPKQIPSNQDESSVANVFADMYSSIVHLKQCAIDSRTKSIAGIRFSSAIGPIIRFNVPEAIEFILRHNERHLFQIERLLDVNYDGYFANQD